MASLQKTRVRMLFLTLTTFADTHTAGNPSIVFDAILHPSLKPRLLKNINFKSFVLGSPTRISSHMY